MLVQLIHFFLHTVYSSTAKPLVTIMTLCKKKKTVNKTIQNKETNNDSTLLHRTTRYS